MAVEMTIKKISENVGVLLQNLKNLDNITDFVTVLPAPPDKEADFAGYPSASHYYGNTQSDYATVSQNRRVIEYIVELYIIGNKNTVLSDLLQNEAYPLLDRVIQMFDQSVDLSNTGLGLTRACELMRPTPGTIERIETNEGKGWSMQISLFCEADITFRDS